MSVVSDPKLCWGVTSMFGYSLREGVIFIGFTTIVISVIAFGTSLVGLSKLDSKDISYSNPVDGANFIFALYCLPMSIYQIVISLLFLWKTMKADGNVFFCTLWYVSHVSITMFYTMLFIAKATACFIAKAYLNGAFTIVTGVFHTGLFAYFCLVVSSYSYTIDDQIFY